MARKIREFMTHREPPEHNWMERDERAGIGTARHAVELRGDDNCHRETTKIGLLNRGGVEDAEAGSVEKRIFASPSKVELKEMRLRKPSPPNVLIGVQSEFRLDSR